MITRTSPQMSSVSDILASSGKLSQLRDHIQKLDSLQTKLRDYPGPPLNKHVIVADYRQKTLIFHADSAAWATKLRYLTPELLRLFRDDLPGLRSIRIKNLPVETTVQKTRRAARASPDTVDAIRQVADRITDSPLRSVLLRIADKLFNGTGETGPE